eukprot:1519460-Amphidinium_carterae.1
MSAWSVLYIPTALSQLGCEQQNIAKNTKLHPVPTSLSFTKLHFSAIGALCWGGRIRGGEYDGGYDG